MNEYEIENLLDVEDDYEMLDESSINDSVKQMKKTNNTIMYAYDKI